MLSVRFELFVDEKDLETNIEIIKAIAKAILENKAIITKTSIWKVSDDELRKLFSSYLGVER
jgi:hypothetical protein